MRLLTLALTPLVLVACAANPVIVGGPFPGDPENFTYDLEGTSVTLQKGTHEVKTGDKPDDLIATDLTGFRLDADLDGDESTDRAVVLTRDEGTMKAHYLVVLRNTGSVVATKAVRLGKNVLVEQIELSTEKGAPKGTFVVRMKDRDADTPEDTPPTVDVAKKFRVKDGVIESVK